MKKKLILIIIVIMLCTLSACQQEMTDEEILARAEEIWAENPTATAVIAEIPTPKPTVTPPLKSSVYIDKNLGITEEDFLRNYYYLREISEPLQHLTGKLAEPDVIINGDGDTVKNYYLYKGSEAFSALFLSFVYSGNEQYFSHIALTLAIKEENEEISKLFDDYSMAFIITYVLSKNSPMEYNNEVFDVATDFINNSGDKDEVILKRVNISTTNKSMSISIAD